MTTSRSFTGEFYKHLKRINNNSSQDLPENRIKTKKPNSFQNYSLSGYNYSGNKIKYCHHKKRKLYTNNPSEHRC
jgi:hypothetical protein